MMALEIPDSVKSTLSAPHLTDFCVNPSGACFADFGSGLFPVEKNGVPVFWESHSLKTWIIQQLSRVGKSWDANQPYLDAMLPEGFRLHAIFPPVVSSPTLSLRNLSQLGRSKAIWSTDPCFKHLVEVVRAKETLVISGATSSGKTTLMNELIEQISANERLLALEDTPELRPSHPHFVSLNSRPPNADGFGEVTLRQLFRQTLRMRPDRIFIGECRGAEVVELLQALNAGHCGSLATLHAHSVRDALRRLELLCLVSGTPLSPRTIRELLCSGIDWIVQLETKDGTRKIKEMGKVESLEGDTILIRPMLLKGT